MRSGENSNPYHGKNAEHLLNVQTESSMPVIVVVRKRFTYFCI